MSLGTYLTLHSFQANWSTLKFAIGNPKLLTPAFSVFFLNSRDQISLLLLGVHVKYLLRWASERHEDVREMARVKGFERHYKFSSSAVRRKLV